MLLLLFLSSLSEFTRPSRIVFGDGSFMRGGLDTLIQWMVDNRDKGYFKNLEYFQVTGHNAAAHDALTNSTELTANIVSNLNTMCTDKENFPKLTMMNFNTNGYNEFNDGFDAALRGTCNRAETGVRVNAMQRQLRILQFVLLQVVSTSGITIWLMKRILSNVISPGIGIWVAR